MKRVVWLFAVITPLLGLSACGGSVGGAGNSNTAPFIANFDPANSVIPFPNDLLFLSNATSLSDGTLNIPVVNPADFTDPKVAMNTLDGFSTSAPISTTFSAPLLAASVDLYSVHVYEVSTIPATVVNPLADPYATVVTSVLGELGFGTQYLAIPSPSDPSTLVIKPLVPLKSNTHYMVVLTDGLTSTAGTSAINSLTFSFLKQTTSLVDATGKSLIPASDVSAQQLEGLRGLTGAMLTAAASQGINSANVVLTWTFKTQTLNKVLPTIQIASATDVYATDPYSFITVPAVPSAGTNNLGVLDFYSFALATAATGNTALIDGYTSATGNVFANIGSVVIGAVKLPYYLDDTSVNPQGPITGTFQFNPGSNLPITKSVQTAPFLLTVPNSAGPWPVVIFQHGFTVDKSVVFGIANTLAKAGFATIAIDAVLHGDRTFGLDLVNNTTGAAGPDGLPDASGTHYLNLSYLLTARDNIRQSVADLIHLTRLIENQTMDVVNNTTGLPGADTAADLVPGVVGFVGHSNGGILGTMLAAVEPNIPTFVLANPGAVYSDIFQNSVEISPLINAGLSAKGVTIPSPDYFAFLAAAQTVADDGDPFNYAAAAAATKKILLFKQLGDLVVPNASTDLLSGAMSLPQVAAGAGSWPIVVSSPYVGGSGFVKFIQGTHSSFLKPDPFVPPATLVGLDVITEMQTETATFLGSVGTAIIITNSTGPSSGLPIVE